MSNNSETQFANVQSENCKNMPVQTKHEEDPEDQINLHINRIMISTLKTANDFSGDEFFSLKPINTNEFFC